MSSLRAPHGQLRDVLEERADHLGLHRLAPDALEAPELAVDLLAHVLGQGVLRELLLELLEVRGVLALALAELLLDRAELLAQEHLALAVADLLLDLGLDVLLRGEDADLPLDGDEDAAQAVLHRERLEKLLAVGRRDVDVAGDEVREPARLIGLAEELLDGLLGEAHLLAELGGALARLLVEGEEHGVLRIGRRHLGRRHDDGLEHAALLLRDAHRDAAALPLEQEAHAAEAALDRAHLRDRADRVEAVGRHAFDVGALGEREDERVASRAERGLDRAHRAAPPGGDRRRHAREEDGVAEGKDRKGQGFRHEHPNGARHSAIPQCESGQRRLEEEDFLEWFRARSGRGRRATREGWGLSGSGAGPPLHLPRKSSLFYLFLSPSSFWPQRPSRRARTSTPRSAASGGTAV